MWAAKSPCEGIAELITAKRGGLRQVEVCAVCQIGKDEFVGEIELRVCGGGILGEWRNVVVEVVIVEREVIDASWADDGRYARQERVETIERVLALRCE